MGPDYSVIIISEIIFHQDWATENVTQSWATQNRKSTVLKVSTTEMQKIRHFEPKNVTEKNLHTP